MDEYDDYGEYFIDETEYEIKDNTVINTILGYNTTVNLKEQLKNMEHGE